MRRRTGWLILACALVPVSLLTADSGRTRTVADATPEKAAPEKAAPEKATVKPDEAGPVNGDNKGRGKNKAKATPGITPEREAAAKTFVDQHHPELAGLLVHLKENNKKEYEKAVRDLFKTSERLARFHEMDVERYDLELKLWQTQSRIDLLAARYKMTPTNALKKQLKDAIVEQHNLQKSLVGLERERTSERLAKLDEQLKGLENFSNKAVDERLQSLTGATEIEKTDKTDKPASKGAKSK